MFFKKAGPIRCLQFELLTEIPGLVHGVLSRQGGVSTGCYSSLNAAFHVGDLAESVQKNHDLIRKALHLSSLILMNQVHGVDIGWIQDQKPFSSPADGLMTQGERVALTVLHADCQAAIFCDPVRRGLAVVHAGWRGQVQGIYSRCIEQMRACFGSQPQDVLVGISPSLGPSYAEFLHYQLEFPEPFWSFQDTPYHFNLWEIARFQLEQSGVLPHHIEIAKICTYTHPEEYFSYRRDHTTGRNATVACFI